MDFGAFSSGLLTGLREGVEAALILAIICAYLARTGNAHFFSKVFAGAGLALGLSAILGVGLFVTVGSFHEPYEQLFEGLTMIAAATVVTWMLFWMRRQARSVKGELQAAVERAVGQEVAGGSATALAVLAFIAVIREGIETSLFLTGQAAAASADGGAVWVLAGAVIGIAVAALLGVGFYHGSRRLNLNTFFRWTGVALVFIAAGLLSYAAHEFIEIGVITFGTGTLFDISAVLPHSAEGGNVLGQMLRALFGYTSTPEVTTFAVWLTYIVVVLALFLRPTRSGRVPVGNPASTTAAEGR
jgi:high-affinity iron transporter